MPALIWKILATYLLAVNVAAFALMGADKHRAKKERWRIKERTLFLPVILGGGLSGTLGMRLFHHKTRHWYFKFGFPALLIAQIVLLALLWVKVGIA